MIDIYHYCSNIYQLEVHRQYVAQQFIIIIPQQRPPRSPHSINITFSWRRLNSFDWITRRARHSIEHRWCYLVRSTCTTGSSSSSSNSTASKIIHRNSRRTTPTIDEKSRLANGLWSKSFRHRPFRRTDHFYKPIQSLGKSIPLSHVSTVIVHRYQSDDLFTRTADILRSLLSRTSSFDIDRRRQRNADRVHLSL